MKFDTVIAATSFASIRDFARWAEEIGHDGLWSIETAHDPFMQLAIAAADTTRVNLGTAIAVAFPRNPTVLLILVWDHKPTPRGDSFLVSAPVSLAGDALSRCVASQKLEMILAMRAVWDCWQNGTPLRFEEFCRLTM
jgi:hypothetical protein